MRRMRPKLACGLLTLVCASPSGARDVVFARKAAALYSLAPDIKACTAGALSVPQKRRVRETMNAIRALHGLAPVTYDESAGAGVMQIAPMIAANRQVSHAPSAL